MARKVINKKDAIAAIVEDGAYLCDNGSPIPHYYVVWGNWEKWKTVRYDTFYSIKESLEMESSRDDKAVLYKLKKG